MVSYATFLNPTRIAKAQHKVCHKSQENPGIKTIEFSSASETLIPREYS